MKIEVRVEKKQALLMIGVFLMVAGALAVYAYNISGAGSNPPVFGHSADEIMVNMSDGQLAFLSDLVSSRLPECAEGQAATYNSEDGWGCISIPTAASISGNLIFNQHTETQCISLGGTVVTSNNVKFCKFTGTKVNQDSGCPSGWALYNSWSTTTGKTCSNGELNFWARDSCETGQHAWADKARESCQYEGVKGMETCYATYAEVGCY